MVNPSLFSSSNVKVRKLFMFFIVLCFVVYGRVLLFLHSTITSITPPTTASSSSYNFLAKLLQPPSPPPTTTTTTRITPNAWKLKRGEDKKLKHESSSSASSKNHNARAVMKLDTFKIKNTNTNSISSKANATTTKANTTTTTTTVNNDLRKPLPPAIICSSLFEQRCNVQLCPSSSRVVVSMNTTTVNTGHERDEKQQLSSLQQQQQQQLIQPYPKLHYGYGYIQRDSIIRGSKMIVSGTATSGSGCAISHTYQFIFIHVLKSGGTTIKGFLQQALCNGTTILPCSTGIEQLEIVNCASTITKYPNYFTFSFVRNPYSRIYSSYAMAYSFRDNLSNSKLNKRSFTFEEFTLGYDLNNTISTSSTPTPIPPVSTQSKNIYRTKLSYLHPSHYSLQTNYLFSSSSCPVVDFIGHLETLKDDLETILTYIDSKELWEYYYYKMNPNNNNNNNTNNVGLEKDTSTAFGVAKKKQDLDGNLQKAYHIHTSSSSSSSSWTNIQQAVATEYQRDFELLGYDPNVVPS